MSKYDNGLKYDFKIEDGGFAYDYKLYQLIINLFEGIYVNDDSKEIITYLLKTERVALTDDMIAMAFPSMTDSLRTTDADGLNLSVFIEHLESIGVLQDFAYLLATIMLIENNLNVREEITSFVQVMLEEKSAIMEYVKSDLYSGTILNFVMNRYGKTTELTVKGSLELDGNTFSNVNGDLTVYASNSSGTVTDSIIYNDVTLNSIGEIYDYILDGDRYYNIGVRDYESGDEDLSNVVTNGTITYYVRSETLIEPNGTKYMPYEGEYITANNSSLGLTDGLEVRGKTYQNLARLDLPESELFNAFRGVLSNGIYTLSETAVGIAAPRYRYNMNLYKPNTAYTFVFNVYSNTSNTILRHVVDPTVPSLFNANLELIPIGSTGIIKVLMTTSNFANVSDYENIFRFYMQHFTGEANLGSFSFSFMILEGDYTNVDLPPTITGIESVESPVIKSVGKNLFDENSDNAIIDSSNTYGYFDLGLDKNKTYMMTLTEKDSSIDISSMYFGWTEYGSGVLEQNSTRWIVNNGIFMINGTNLSDRGNSCKYLSFYPNNLTTIEAILNRYNIQVELGSTATAYEPYTEDSVSYDGIELRRVGDVYDYVDVANNRIVRNIGVVEFDGTESWNTYSDATSNNYAYSISKSEFKLGTYTSICNKFKNVYGAWELGVTSEKIIYSDHANFANKYFVSELETLEEWKAYLAEQYSSGEPVTVYYQLATPTYEDLPTRQLKTWDGTTHIFSENSNVEPQIYARILTVDEDRYTEINELELLESATTITSSCTTIQPNLSFYIETSDVELFALASLADRLGFTDVEYVFALLKMFDKVGISDLDEPRTAISDWYIGTDDTMDNRFNTWLSPFDMLIDPRQSDLGIMPPVEHTQIDLPYADGSIFQDAKYTNRMFNLVSYSAQGLSVSQKEELKEQIVSLLASTKTEPKKMTFSSNSLTFDVRYSGELGFEEAPSWIKATIPLESQPYGYKQFSEEVNGDGIIVNDGHADLGVKVEIRDGCVIPNFTIGGTEFTWDGTVPSGNKLVIDNEDKTCYLVDALGNKTQALQKLTDGSSFRTIPKGTQAVVQCLNDSTRSHLHIEYQPKYLWKGADLTDE